MMELEQYKMLEKIGEGAHGVVYKALDAKNNAIVAVKKMRVDKVNGIRSSNLREVVLMKKLQHDNVVRVFDVVYTYKGLYLVLEYLDVNLDKHMSSCLEYSHDPHLVKLADFGFARLIQSKILSREVMTPGYTPPEILLGSKEYSFSADMWSIGCIFAEMVNRKPLFGGDSQIRQLSYIFKTMGTPKEVTTWPGITKLPDFMATFPEWVAKDLATVVPDLDKVGLDLLRKMLSVHPNSRITPKLALEHQYFKGITFP